MARVSSAQGTYREVDKDLTITGAAYVANDCVGGLQTIVFGFDAVGGVLEDIILYDRGAQNAEIEVYVFNKKPTAIANADELVLVDADVKKTILTGTLNDWRTVGGGSMARLSDYFNRASLGIPYVGKTLYIYLKAVATPDWVVGDLSLKVVAKS